MNSQSWPGMCGQSVGKQDRVKFLNIIGRGGRMDHNLCKVNLFPPTVTCGAETGALTNKIEKKC